MISKKQLNFTIQSALIGCVIALLYLYLFTDPSPLKKNPHTEPVLSYAHAISRAAPFVVSIYASRVYKEDHPFFVDSLFHDFFGESALAPKKRLDSRQGSGVIINQEGIVLTNAHVVKYINMISVTLPNGHSVKAKLLGIDKDTDIAVLRIAIQSQTAIPIGDSSQLRTGDIVLTIGNPYNVGQTVTQGIISGVGRTRLGITTFENFIQTDADFNPGNSGGALINGRGELIGINTAIISSTGGSQGINLATPINQAIHIMKDLIKHGQVIRGWIGIEAQDLTQEAIKMLGIQGGARVIAVLQGGPADQASIMPGDIITHIDNVKITNPHQAINLITALRPDKRIEIALLRGWKEKRVWATTAQRPTIRR